MYEGHDDAMTRLAGSFTGHLLAATVKLWEYMPHTYGYAWPYPQVLEVLKQIKENNYVVLGGDVLQKRGTSFEYESSNWYVKSRPMESWGDYVARSYEESVTYINKFPDKDGAFIFALVFVDESGFRCLQK
jgi:hypothetical protein